LGRRGGRPSGDSTDYRRVKCAAAPPPLFTEDADASAELGRLPKAAALAFRPPETAGGAAVTISHEPWSGAAIHLDSRPAGPNPGIVCDAIRFIVPNVALAGVTWAYRDDAATQTIQLLFVMKKEGDKWKIASLRTLSPR